MVLIIEGQGDLIHKYPSTPSFIISFPSESSNATWIPGRGNPA